MRRVVLVLSGLLVALGSTSIAGTISIEFESPPLVVTSTAKQNADLQRLLNKTNADRAQEVPPRGPLTMNEFIQQELLGEAFKQAKHAADVYNRQAACAAWPTVPPQDQAQMISQLGGNSPCPQ